MKMKRPQGLYKLAALVRHHKIDDGLESFGELKPWDSYWDNFWEGYWENYWDNYWEGHWQEDRFQ